MQKTGWTRPPREINDHKRNQKKATKVGFEPQAANHYRIRMDFTIFISVVTEIMEYFIGYLEMRVTGSPIGYSEVPWQQSPGSFGVGANTDGRPYRIYIQHGRKQIRPAHTE